MTPIVSFAGRFVRTAALVIAMALVPAAAWAQQQVIRGIDVQGTQRIEPGTVLSYMYLRPGEIYSDAVADQSLKTLFATGLFADVKMSWDGSTLTVYVVENPIINQVDFDGNSKISNDDLLKEIQLKPRMVFTRTKVQADVQRIIELYRRSGRFAATVDPKIIQRPQNRVDLIFEISEGPTTGISRINFIGNRIFEDSELKDQLATVETRWWRFLNSNDNYDPDRLTFDREQLRRFYLRRGYADFRVIAAVAELTPDRRDFFLTFTLEEGPQYRFGNVEVSSTIRDLNPDTLRALVPIESGDVYNAELLDKSIESLTFAAGSSGYAFAEVRPRVKRDRDALTIDVIFQIEEGPRVYIDKINIVGNTRTLDRVIRREFRLVEGDAFNRVLVNRSRTRIRALGFFSKVEITEEPGSAPDRTVLTVSVEEQATGELSLGAGFSSTDAFVAEFSYTERNLFGRGQFLRTRLSLSNRQQQYDFRFTEPYLFDRPLSAGFDIYKIISDFKEADYRSDTTALGLRFGFPISEYGRVGMRYTYRLDELVAAAGAPLPVLLAQGDASTSVAGFTMVFDTRDDPIRPRAGLRFSFSQDFAGLGGDLKYLRTESSLKLFQGLPWDLVGTFGIDAGYITGYDGQDVRINERFFKGGATFRGFEQAGIGPRDIASVNSGALGGEAFAIGTFELLLPGILPDEFGIDTLLFTDVGTVGILSSASDICTSFSCIKDDLALRVSAGVSFNWQSPFGPVRVDIGQALLKEDYDKTEVIRFSAGTRF